MAWSFSISGRDAAAGLLYRIDQELVWLTGLFHFPGDEFGIARREGNLLFPGEDITGLFDSRADDEAVEHCGRRVGGMLMVVECGKLTKSAGPFLPEECGLEGIGVEFDDGVVCEALEFAGVAEEGGAAAGVVHAPLSGP